HSLGAVHSCPWRKTHRRGHRQTHSQSSFQQGRVPYLLRTCGTGTESSLGKSIYFPCQPTHPTSTQRRRRKNTGVRHSSKQRISQRRVRQNSVANFERCRTRSFKKTYH